MRIFLFLKQVQKPLLLPICFVIAGLKFFCTLIGKDFYGGVSVLALGLLSFFISCTSSQVTSSDKFLKKISPGDLSILEGFFQDLIQKESLGYVIFGDKPLISVEYENAMSDTLKFITFSAYNLKLFKGMECWRKYAPLFSSKNFTFLFFGHPSKNKHIELLVINRPVFIQTVEHHKKKFEKVLGPCVSGEMLLEKISNCTEDWTDLLRKNHELLGILFGYGQHNAHLFQRLMEISEMHYACNFTLNKRKTIPRPGFASIDSEIQYLKDHLQRMEADTSLESEYMVLPSLKVDPFEVDYNQFMHKYRSQRKKIFSIYKNGPFFKKTMVHMIDMPNKVQESAKSASGL